VIAPEVSQRLSQGKGILAATPVLKCCKPSTCQPRFNGRFSRQFLRKIEVEHYLPELQAPMKLKLIEQSVVLDMGRILLMELME